MKELTAAEFEELCASIVAKANERCDKSDTKGYIGAIIDEALIAFGSSAAALCINNDCLYKHIDDAMKETKGLVLFEPECLPYLAYELAHEDSSRTVALTLPYYQEERFGAEIRYTHTDIAPELWDRYTNFILEVSTVLKACLTDITSRFHGAIISESQLHEAADEDCVNRIRVAVRPLEIESTLNTFDPVGEVHCLRNNGDELQANINSLNKNQDTVDAIVWICNDADETDYDLTSCRKAAGCIFMNQQHHGLKEIVQLRREDKCHLFVWDTAYSGPVRMTEETGEEARSKHVPSIDLGLNLNYSPRFYFDNNKAIATDSLGNLVKRIRRGTRLSGKDLDIRRKATSPWPDMPSTLENMLGGWNPFHLQENEVLYVDNASLSEEIPLEEILGDPQFYLTSPDVIQTLLKDANHVIPLVLGAIPDGQERYTILPEDETVVLMQRDCKCVECYKAERPTLISNNLFIIWPDREKVTAEYLACAIRGTLASRQIQPLKKPVSKGDLMDVRIPVPPKELQDEVVKRRKERLGDIYEKELDLHFLREEDPLDCIWETDKA